MSDDRWTKSSLFRWIFIFHIAKTNNLSVFCKLSHKLSKTKKQIPRLFNWIASEKKKLSVGVLRENFSRKFGTKSNLTIRRNGISVHFLRKIFVCHDSNARNWTKHLFIERFGENWRHFENLVEKHSQLFCAKLSWRLRNYSHWHI